MAMAAWGRAAEVAAAGVAVAEEAPRCRHAVLLVCPGRLGTCYRLVTRTDSERTSASTAGGKAATQDADRTHVKAGAMWVTKFAAKDLAAFPLVRTRQRAARRLPHIGPRPPFGIVIVLRRGADCDSRHL